MFKIAVYFALESASAGSTDLKYGEGGLFPSTDK